MTPKQGLLPIHDLVVDNFAGGGGASTGIEQALGAPVDFAINHDARALAMHERNHPFTYHLREDVFRVDPVALCGGRRVAGAWFSPDCTHHSKAKGGKPRSKKLRGLAWVVVKWAATVRPGVIWLENVEEFADWGPLRADGTPCPLRKGLTFRRWKRELERLGYTVESRELRACDFGAPTTRKRLFVVARCDGQPIRWPEPTHGPGRKPYRTAAECIDWSLPCPSIFDRQRPLAENTLRRIAAGVIRYVVNNPKPFIVPVTHHGDTRVHGIDEPLRTVTCAARGELALIAPTVARLRGTSDAHLRGSSSPADDPLGTISAQGTHHAVVAASMVQTGYGEREGQAPRALNIEAPLGTVVAGGQKHALVSAFLAKHYSGVVGHGLCRPIGTVTAQDHHSVVEVALGADHREEVAAFLLKYYGTDQDPKLNEPLHTVTTKHRFGLVTVRGIDYCITDIGMRMLQPRELAAAQGFPADYNLDGLTKTEAVRMIGNSVPPALARAVVLANPPLDSGAVVEAVA